ncbi:MAG TPA: NAD(P)/FAD-dependent oxidoreductase [Geopsychrobacteraceae bacterium]|nr:NAD(P)/FAD-dependent oxidoreductase [Geopsychrobacteraceae bacterium]
MHFRLREIPLSLDEDEGQLPTKVAEYLNIQREQIYSWTIVRKGIDARKKPKVLRVYTVDLALHEDIATGLDLDQYPRLSRLEEATSQSQFKRFDKAAHVLVVGMGPAGLFSALHLANSGARVTLIERGQPVSRRLQQVRSYWAGGQLDPENNVQFGEGGAGTFSDGKLTSRLNHPLTRKVLETLVDFGAPEEILLQAKPHIGSDRLRGVLSRFRNELERLGVDIRFATKLTGLGHRDNRVNTGILNDSIELPCDALVLAPGHSARDTYRLLADSGILLESKPFAIGLRVEHPTTLINQIQYGMKSHPQLPPAEYALTWNDRQTGRGVYSFCMCPGGVVINASSEVDGLVVNGMSDYQRDGQFSNSALVVSVRPDDFDNSDPLSGVRFQRKWEQAAFIAGGSNNSAPAQPLLEFFDGRPGYLQSSCRPGIVHIDLKDVLPDFVSQSLKSALPHFNRKMRGFISSEATLIGVETRTSSPLRIVRNEHCESISHAGLYPAGEGAGYAGGIMSAAVDGLRVAEKITQRFSC